MAGLPNLPNNTLRDKLHSICMHLSFLNNLCRTFVYTMKFPNIWFNCWGGNGWFQDSRIGCFPYPFYTYFTPLSLDLWHLVKDLFVTVQLQIGHPLVNVFENVWQALQCFTWLCRDCQNPEPLDFCWMLLFYYQAFKTDEKNTESPGVKVLGRCGERGSESSQITSPNVVSKWATTHKTYLCLLS